MWCQIVALGMEMAVQPRLNKKMVMVITRVTMLDVRMEYDSPPMPEPFGPYPLLRKASYLATVSHIPPQQCLLETATDHDTIQHASDGAPTPTTACPKHAICLLLLQDPDVANAISFAKKQIRLGIITSKDPFPFSVHLLVEERLQKACTDHNLDYKQIGEVVAKFSTYRGEFAAEARRMIKTAWEIDITLPVPNFREKEKRKNQPDNLADPQDILMQLEFWSTWWPNEDADFSMAAAYKEDPTSQPGLAYTNPHWIDFLKKTLFRPGAWATLMKELPDFERGLIPPVALTWCAATAKAQWQHIVNGQPATLPTHQFDRMHAQAHVDHFLVVFTGLDVLDKEDGDRELLRQICKLSVGSGCTCSMAPKPSLSTQNGVGSSFPLLTTGIDGDRLRLCEERFDFALLLTSYSNQRAVSQVIIGGTDQLCQWHMEQILQGSQAQRCPSLYQQGQSTQGAGGHQNFLVISGSEEREESLSHLHYSHYVHSECFEEVLRFPRSSFARQAGPEITRAGAVSSQCENVVKRAYARRI
ncbi:hypothetical protein BT69DRAFT_1296622 [Atractiella rhizophila]|nr:hypothetical protein BT69DRAFT_1296622 [Atractiella rhizophila]